MKNNWNMQFETHPSLTQRDDYSAVGVSTVSMPQMSEPETCSHGSTDEAGARVIAIANRRRVGKTTTAVNLPTALAASEMRVLLVDIDAPRECASHGLDIDGASGETDGHVRSLPASEMTADGLRSFA